MAGNFIWQNLTHDNTLNSVEKILQEKLSNLLIQRNSYINRVYELEKHDSRERFIVKFYRPGRWTPDMILEEHQFLKELSQKEIPVIVPLEINKKTLFEFKALDPRDIYFALFPKKGGRALDEFDKDGWEEIGRLLARVHLIGETHTTTKRAIWKPSIATAHHLQVLLGSDFLLENFKKAFQRTVESFIKKADPMFNSNEFILLHGDCHKGNLIHRPGEGIFMVDFDDMCFGPAAQDIWMLLPDAPENCENEINWFLKGYEIFRPFNQNELELVPYLRAMRIIHFAAWLAVQKDEPDFGKHFPEAGNSKYWNELTRELQEITTVQ